MKPYVINRRYDVPALCGPCDESAERHRGRDAGGEPGKKNAVCTVAGDVPAEALKAAVEEAGYTPAVYFNQDLAQNTFRLRELQAYDFWLAQYEDAMTFSYDVDMWQYSCTGPFRELPEMWT